MVTSLNLKLYVPEPLIAKVIGKGGKNIKKMAAEMRVERIQVLPLEKKPGINSLGFFAHLLLFIAYN